MLAPEHMVGDRVSMEDVVEQPSVEFLLVQGLLDSVNIWHMACFENRTPVGKHFQSLSDNPCVKRLYSVGLQADIVNANTCPPEGGRYIDQNQVLARALSARQCAYRSASPAANLHTFRAAALSRGDSKSTH